MSLIDETRIVVTKLNTIVQAMDVKTRKKVLGRAARPLRKSARDQAPTGKPKGGQIYRGAVSVRYDTPKVSKRIKTPKGKGRIKAWYFRGNVKRSIKILRFRRSSSVYVGPRYGGGGNTSGDFGRTASRVDGYYSHMIYGGALPFRRKVMIPALEKSQGEVVKTAEKEFSKIVKSTARKSGLNVR
ncbi:MAG: hypothetical protein ACO2Y1_07735 [Flavobacteriaceae bacterium]